MKNKQRPRIWCCDCHSELKRVRECLSCDAEDCICYACAKRLNSVYVAGVNKFYIDAFYSDTNKVVLQCKVISESFKRKFIRNYTLWKLEGHE